MRALQWSALVLLASCALGGVVAAQKTEPPLPLVLRNVTVIDGTGAQPVAGRAVTIDDGRIISVEPDGDVEAPEGAREVDASGRFLIPGLWDMHVHTTYGLRPKSFFPLFVANGVTGVRDMFGNPRRARDLREEIEYGERVGPRIVASGRIVDGPRPYWRGSASARDAEAGRAIVEKQQEAGVDFVKVYSGLPRDAYFAIATEARKRGIPFAGHVPRSVRAGEAAAAGQKSIEHLTEVLLACSAREDEIREARGGARLAPAERRRRRTAERREILESFDADKAAALFAQFAEHGTWQCPTFTVQRSFAFQDTAEITEDPRLRYLPRELVSSWDPRSNPRARGTTAEAYEVRKREFRKHLEIVGAMHEAGVKILAGTDVANPYCLPGFSLHDELEMLVRAGLTPMAALQSATRLPAEYLGLLDDTGTVEVGKRADLVLLDANPLDDIRHTTRIRAVVLAGRWLDRAALDALLGE